MPGPDTVNSFEIINGDGNDPPFPFVIVNRSGTHVDLTNIDGELFDAPTTARVSWGYQHPNGRRFGKIELKNGEARMFWDRTLIEPYVGAWKVQMAQHAAAAGTSA